MRTIVTLITPLMNGGSLAKLIYQTELVNGKPSQRRLLLLTTQQDMATILHDILSGVAFLHE